MLTMLQRDVTVKRFLLFLLMVSMIIGYGEQAHAAQKLSQEARREGYQKIQELLSSGKFEEAIKRCNDFLKIDNRDANFWNMKGFAYVSTGKFGDALNCFNIALKNAPEAASFWANKGMVLATLNRHEEALNSYNKAVALDPQMAGAWSGRGGVLDDLGRYIEAIESYDRALEIEPDSTWMLVNKIGALDNLVEKGGQAELDKFLSLAPAKPAEYFNKGYVLLSLEKYGACSQIFTKLTQLQPKNARAWYLQGLCLMSATIKVTGLSVTDKHPDIIEAFQKAIRLAPLSQEGPWDEPFARDAEKFIQILSYRGNVNTKDPDGVTPLMLAVETEEIQIVKLLLEQGADVNATDNDGWDALMYAASNGSPEIVKLLVEYGAEVNQAGYTPLMAAARWGHADAVKVLLQYGADKHAQINREGSKYQGWTAMKFAEAENHTEIVQLLKEVVQTPQTQYPETAAKPGQRYDIEKDIGEQLLKKFATTEFVALWGVLKGEGVPEDKIEELMNSEEFVTVSSMELLKLLEEWGPDMARLDPEKMSENMRQALEGCRNTIRAEAQKGLAKIAEQRQLEPQVSSPTQSLTTAEQLTAAANSEHKNVEGDYIEAIQRYTNAIKSDPNNLENYYHRGTLLTKIGEYERSMADFMKFIETEAPQHVLSDLKLVLSLSQTESQNSPYYPTGWTVRGYTWSKIGEDDCPETDCNDMAIDEFTRAIDIDPQYDLAYFYRGGVWAEKGDYDQALTDYTRALEIDPRNPEAYFRRSMVWHKKGDLDQSIKDVKKAIKFLPRKEYQDFLNQLLSEQK